MIVVDNFILSQILQTFTTKMFDYFFIFIAL